MNPKSTTKTMLVAALCLHSATAAFSEATRSDLPAEEARRIVREDSQTASTFDGQLGGYDELVPFALASPDQDEAGSCLYMATTGIAEWWLARLSPNQSRVADGPIDLSERYLMNIAGLEESNMPLRDWRTDSIYLFNQNRRQSLPNSSYRFTKGWYLGEEYSSQLEATTPNAPGASYGTMFNWIDQRPQRPARVVNLPEFEREVIFADPTHNQWNVGVAPQNIAETVKQLLRTKKAPVLVIYNQNSYWHAVYIIGYNDEMDNGECSYTEGFRTRIRTRAEELERQTREATDPEVKAAYQIRAQRAREAMTKIETAYTRGGGCTNSKGVFYIRDSIYPDTGGPSYDYDPMQTGDEAPYARRIVFKEYDWLKYFANHISVVYPKL